jgi:hypothetical protein
MLFRFECSADQLANLPLDVLESAVSSLLRAHRLGEHLIVIPRSLATGIAQRADLSRIERATLDRIAKDYTQSGTLHERATIFVEITGDNADVLRSRGNRIQVSLSQIEKTRMLERPILLVENLVHDGLLYGSMLEHHYDLHKAPRPVYDVQHGGGDELANVMPKLIEQKKIICAIVDSDKNSPYCPASLKYRKIRSLIDASDWPLNFVLSPPCREAENCLPLSLVLSLPCGVGNAANGLLLAIDTEEQAKGHDRDERFWLFFDVKDGVTRSRFFEAVQHDEGRNWFDAKIQLIGLTPNATEISGYGSRLFDQLAADGRYIAEFRRLTRQSDWRETFADFIDDFVWIFAGGRRVAT